MTPVAKLRQTDPCLDLLLFWRFPGQMRGPSRESQAPCGLSRLPGRRRERARAADSLPAGTSAACWVEGRNDTGDNEISKPARKETRCGRARDGCSGDRDGSWEPGVVCFGELLLRLNAPGRELLLQTQQLQVYIGGAEANVAVSLARFGHAASMVSVVPDSPLGAACIGELRRHGVRTDHVYRGEGRLGLYFMATGAGHRPSEIVYDRADSAFALGAGELIDWDEALAGCGVAAHLRHHAGAGCPRGRGRAAFREGRA